MPIPRGYTHHSNRLIYYFSLICFVTARFFHKIFIFWEDTLTMEMRRSTIKIRCICPADVWYKVPVLGKVSPLNHIIGDNYAYFRRSTDGDSKILQNSHLPDSRITQGQRYNSSALAIWKDEPKPGLLRQDLYADKSCSRSHTRSV
jgi:hypothetical protein